MDDKVKNEAPKPVAHINIVLLSNGNLQVTGIPNIYNMAMEMVAKAPVAVGSYFLNKALEGKLDEQGNVKADVIQQVSTEMGRKLGLVH